MRKATRQWIGVFRTVDGTLNQNGWRRAIRPFSDEIRLGGPDYCRIR
jgi:hypothetical protein